MSSQYTTATYLPGNPIWGSIAGGKRSPLSFYLELTARCNLNCTHCYINLPARDRLARQKELSLEEWKPVIDEAVSMGALWCHITGGEPLLRPDFSDIYIYLKKKGLLVSVFTNAALIRKKHIRLFKAYPPRDLEVTVYGITRETFEAVTRVSGSFKRFQRGLDLLLRNNVPVRLKTMALRSNLHELPAITDFCASRTKDYFRFDPFLHLRYDRDEHRNREIRSERLTPKEIVALEQGDANRFQALTEGCDQLIFPEDQIQPSNRLFRCGAGNRSFYLSADGIFHLCGALRNPDCIYDLKQGSLREAWEEFVPRVRSMRATREEYSRKCGQCAIVNLCLECPAHVDLETGSMDQVVEYFCQVAHQRKQMLQVVK